MEMENTIKGMLTDGFLPVSTAQWEEKIREDLQGADYERRLIWETHDRYRIRPYYRREDLGEIGYLESLPGQFPYLRGSGSTGNSWLIREDIPAGNVRKANLDALGILERGVTSIGFEFPQLRTLREKDIHSLLRNLPLEKVPVNFILDRSFPEVLGWLHSHALDGNIDPSLIKGSLSMNPLGRLTATGNWRKDMLGDFSELAHCLEFARSNLPLFRVVHNCGNIFHESGASVTQELAFTLAMGNEYLVQLTGMGYSLQDILPRIQFRFSIGSSYFMEIAKLRAARFLWSRILQAYPGFREDMPAMFILSQTSGWNQTLYDQHVNMLRGTTEAMSAILGGTDSLTVLPFNRPGGESDQFSRRIARNIQVILREESYMDKVIDPSAGSYYIENLTDTLIGGTWELFLKTEERGGYQKALIDGFIQEQVNGTARLRLDNLANRKEMLIGTNQYPIFDEKVTGENGSKVAAGVGNRAVEDRRAGNKTPSGYKSPSGDKIRVARSPEQHRLVDPLETFRNAAEFEQLRLKTENHPGKQPVVFIIPLGNLAMRRARAMFTMNFFACAGFRVVDNIGKFKTVRQGIDAARGEGADIVVLCSSDEEYSSMAADMVSLAGSDLIPVIAGYPKEHADALKKAGVKHFIHLKSNVLEELRTYQQLLGI
jgi:methylmalonyl-CoA mutase